MLKPFALDTLLILYLQYEKNKLQGLNVLLNKQPVPKPLVGIRLSNENEFFLVAAIDDLPRIGAAAVEILDQTGSRVAFKESLTPFERRDVAALPLSSRIPVWNGLLRKVPLKFPQIPALTLHRVASALALSEVCAAEVPGCGTYFRLPYVFADSAPNLQNVIATLCRITPEGLTPLEKMSVLGDRGWIHGLMTSGNDAVDQGREILILDIQGLGPVPFMLPANDQQISCQTALREYPGNVQAVKDFLSRRIRTKSTVPAGDCIGRVEGMRGHFVVGWACNREQPDDPVLLDVYVEDRFVRTIVADVPRKITESERYPANTGFSFALSETLIEGEPRAVRICYAGTATEIDQSPLSIGKGVYDSDFWIDPEGSLNGWARERCASATPAELEILVDQRAVGRLIADQFSETLGEFRIPLSNSGFRIDLPDQVFDGNEHHITVRVVEGEKSIAIDRSLRIAARYSAQLTTLTSNRVTGSLVNESAPLRPVDLDLIINGKIINTTRTRTVPGQEGGHGAAVSLQEFEFEIPGNCLAEAGVTLALFVSGTRTQVCGSEAVITPYDLATRLLMTAAETLNGVHSKQTSRKLRISGGLEVNPDISLWFRSQVVAKIISEIRKQKTLPKSVTIPLSSFFAHPVARVSSRAEMIDVIIPVYEGFEQTLECLTTVSRAVNQASCELIVANDHSPDPRLTDLLRQMAAQGFFTLLENDQNLGFVRTVNRAMKLHPERDVVLLNSDTEVPSGWLDRLKEAAYSERNIGTVTPFSNNATILSFPEPCSDNEIPRGMTLAAVDGLFHEHNQRTMVDLPTGVGFCMYIKRDALDEVGYFDEQRWGAGYGEENDFCLRASALGWRHVAACNLFVLHRGAVSFGADSEGLAVRHLDKLNALYPDYSNTVHRFIHQDPLRHSRNKVSKGLLKKHADRFMLFVVHSMGGGTQVAVDELAARLGDENHAVLQLSAKPGNRWALQCVGLPFRLTYQYPEDWNMVARDLADLGIWHIHYHQTMHFPSEIWTLPGLLNTAYDFTAHDYLPVCPRIHMIDESGYYCGNSSLSPEACNRCIELNGPESGLEEKYREFGGEIHQWRTRYSGYLKGARRVFFPSEDTAKRYKRYFDLDNIKVQPHPENTLEFFPLAPKHHNGAYTIAVVGAIGLHKGYNLLRDCARSALKDGLPLRFVVIGYTCDDRELEKYPNTIVTGKYQRNQLPELIKEHQCALALFLSPWPETYGFTLSEAWNAGLYPVALDIGAVAERIKSIGCGEVIPLMSPPKVINLYLLKVIKSFRESDVRLRHGTELQTILGDYYGLERADAMENDPGFIKAGASNG